MGGCRDARSGLPAGAELDDGRRQRRGRRRAGRGCDRVRRRGEPRRRDVVQPRARRDRSRGRCRARATTRRTHDDVGARRFVRRDVPRRPSRQRGSLSRRVRAHDQLRRVQGRAARRTCTVGGRDVRAGRDPARGPDRAHRGRRRRGRDHGEGVPRYRDGGGEARAVAGGGGDHPARARATPHPRGGDPRRRAAARGGDRRARSRIRRSRSRSSCATRSRPRSRPRSASGSPSSRSPIDACFAFSVDDMAMGFRMAAIVQFLAEDPARIRAY